MKLGEVARVARGAVTGKASLFVLSREQAKKLGIEAFVKPVLGGVRDLPAEGSIAHDGRQRAVVILASQRDVEQHPKLSKYLGDTAPRLASVHPAPIAATYTGTPRFVFNPDGLVILNSLYTVRPRQDLSEKELIALVERLNRAVAKLPRGHGYSTRWTPRQLEGLEID